MLSPGQVGLLTGWGVFSTLRVTEGVLFAFERHWARIARDAAAFHVPIPGDPERLRRRLLDLVDANQAYNSTLRLVIVRNGGGMWAATSTGPAFDVIALTAESKKWGDGVKLAYVKHGRHAACPFAGNKVLSWAMNLTWLESAQAHGFDEVILLNETGWSGIRIVEKPLTPAELESSDEVFITSTTRNLLPVLQIEDRKVGRSEGARKALQRAFSEYVRRYIAEHREVRA